MTGHPAAPKKIEDEDDDEGTRTIGPGFWEEPLEAALRS
jgi:hypothetical protein